jgi:hypothetical protein
MGRVLWLIDAPWGRLACLPTWSRTRIPRKSFGDHGLISFRVDEDAELLVIFNILWAG